MSSTNEEPGEDFWMISTKLKGRIWSSEAREVAQLVEDGVSVKEAVRRVCETSGRTPAAVRAECYRKVFKKTGKKARGRERRKLTEDEREKLNELLSAMSVDNPITKAQDVIDIVEKNFKITVSRSWVSRYLQHAREKAGYEMGVDGEYQKRERGGEREEGGEKEGGEREEESAADKETPTVETVARELQKLKERRVRGRDVGAQETNQEASRSRGEAPSSAASGAPRKRRRAGASGGDNVTRAVVVAVHQGDASVSIDSPREDVSKEGRNGEGEEGTRTDTAPTEQKRKRKESASEETTTSAKRRNISGDQGEERGTAQVDRRATQAADKTTSHAEVGDRRAIQAIDKTTSQSQVGNKRAAPAVDRRATQQRQEKRPAQSENRATSQVANRDKRGSVAVEKRSTQGEERIGARGEESTTQGEEKRGARGEERTDQSGERRSARQVVATRL